MTYAEAVQFLYDLRMFGAKFGLENTFKLAALAGNPQQKLRFIHVAGTNGKGSTCAILESIYRAAGLRVGLFTSPHLISFAERIQVNRELIPEPEIIRLVEEIQPLLRQFPDDAHPTFFEVVTVMALKYFAEQKCDLVIWETGMGGRLDATNIVTPLASVITNVEFDHEKWLGHTLVEIAAEKAGIIKPNIPVLTAAVEPDALDVIIKTAREKNARLTPIAFADTRFPPLENLELPLLGEHQRLNAALALGVIRILNDKISVAENAIRDGLLHVNWPGRFQKITRDNQTFVLDGAHNPSGASALRDALAKHFPNEKPTFVLGILQDKEWRQICEIFAPFAGKFFLVPVGSERTASPDELERAVRNVNPAVEITKWKSVKEALEAASRDSLIVITGSLYLIGEALEILQPARENQSIERGLNEYSVRAQPGQLI
jgi:dihydrofolate synthase/folylpolyglutamate synthase